MAKRYLKQVDGEDKLTVVRNPPVYGKRPDYYRGVDWNINDEWYSSDGEDLLNATDPFNDGSLVHKWPLNGDVKDIVTNTSAIVNGELRFSKGLFGQKCYSSVSAVVGDTYLDCGIINRDSFNGITICGWVKNNGRKIQTHSNNIWHLTPDENNIGSNSRQPGVWALSDNNSIYSSNDTESTNDMHYYTDVKDFVTIGNWMFIMQEVTDYEVKTFINNKLHSSMKSNEKMLQNNGRFLIHDKWHSSNIEIQLVEMYSRPLNEAERTSLYNQQRLVIRKHDGLDNNPKAFTYLEQDNKLIVTNVDDKGNIIGQELEDKFGYISNEDNLIKTVENELIDRYGKNVLGGKVNRVIQNTSYIQVSITATEDLANAWATFNQFELDMDTDKFDYVISLTNAVYSSSTSGGGTDINIQANGKTLVTSAHINNDSDSAIYSRAHTYTPKIISGYKGKIIITGNLNKHETSAYTVTNHDNGGVNSGRKTGNNKSDFVVFEIYKENR